MQKITISSIYQENFYNFLFKKFIPNELKYTESLFFNGIKN